MANPKKAKVISRSVSSTSRRRKTKREFRREGGKHKTSRLLGTYVALWNCASCGTKEISGLKKKCPTCDSPKEDRHNEIYYADKKKGKKLSTEEMDKAGISAEHNSDHDCRYCGATLKPTTQVCPICGGKVADSTEDPAAAAAAMGSAIPADKKKPASKKKLGVIPLLIIVGVIVVLCLSCGLISRLFGNSTQKSTVDSVSWRRTVSEEAYEYVEKEGWELPDDADLIDEERKQKGTEQVITGYEDEEKCTTERVQDGYEEVCVVEDITYDDGTTDSVETCTNEPVYKEVEECRTEKVPVYKDKKVYATWYTYDIWDWTEVDSETETGDDYEPTWPTIDVSDDNREGDKVEEYTITFEDTDGKKYEYTTDSYSEFEKYEEGSSWEIEIDKDSGDILEKPKKS